MLITMVESERPRKNFLLENCFEVNLKTDSQSQTVQIMQK